MQLSMTSVRVSWAGLLEKSTSVCADFVKVMSQSFCLDLDCIMLNLRGDTNLFLHYNPKFPSSLNIQVKYWPGSNINQWKMSDKLDKSVTSYIVTNLPPLTPYTFQVNVFHVL